MRYQVANEIIHTNKYLYVQRPDDEKLISACMDDNYRQVLALIGPRQSGKSSLARNMERKCGENDVRVINLDLRVVFSSEELISYRSNKPSWELQSRLAADFVQAIAMEVIPFKDWLAWQQQPEYKTLNEHSPSQYILSAFDSIKTSLSERATVIVLDEWDKLLELGYYAEFLYECLEKIIAEHTVKWLLISNTPPLDMLRNKDRSKFLFFKNVYLHDFNPFDKAVITQWSVPLQYLPQTKAEKLVGTVLQETGGQAFLTGAILQEVHYRESNDSEALEQLINTLVFKRGSQDIAAHFEYAPDILARTPADSLTALAFYQQLFDFNEVVATQDNRDDLLLLYRAGLIKAANVEESTFVFRSPIHQKVFDWIWLEAFRTELLTKISANTGYVRAIKPKNIFVINLGGTMGMEVKEDGTVVAPENNDTFFQRFGEVAKFANIQSYSYRPTDGANIGIHYWQHLAEIIYKAATTNQDVDGFVVVQGTDTMAFTASAVAFSLGPELTKPVVFTGSQVPNNVEHGDSVSNFVRACRVACDSSINEVMICFNDRVMRAVRAEKKHDFEFEGFHTPSAPEFATISQEIKRFNTTGKPVDNTLFAVERFQAVQWQLRNQFCGNIITLSQCPGINIQFVEQMLEQPDVRGVFIESLGVFNIPVAEKVSYEGVLKRAAERHLPIIISSRYPIQPEFMANYGPPQKARQLGAITVGNMTSPAAATKLMWAIAQTDKEFEPGSSEHLVRIKQVMTTNYVGELDS